MDSWWFEDEPADDASFEDLLGEPIEPEEPKPYSPTRFVNEVNDSLYGDFGQVMIEGEVASFKTSQGKWVFFDLKDDETSVSCFLPLWELRMPVEDGMKVVVKATPKVTKWGRFSLTVKQIRPVGEGNLKKAFEMLKKKLTAEGLFDYERKRAIPFPLKRIGVISSTQAAGYADFIKILNERWGGMKIVVAHTQVQGMDAPDQIIRALRYFNEHGGVDVIAILRGGGSADDLSCFNDEQLVREVAASKIPVITGIGHEVDESLVDLAADVVASTPSNAAEMLTPIDRRAAIRETYSKVEQVERRVLETISRMERENYDKIERIGRGLIAKYIEPMRRHVLDALSDAKRKMRESVSKIEQDLRHQMKLLEVLNPEKVLRQGYAILAGKASPGNVVKITTFTQEIEAEVKKVKER